MRVTCTVHPGSHFDAGQRCHLCEKDAARPFTEVHCDACDGNGKRMQRMSARCGIVHPCGTCSGTGKKRVYSEVKT